MVKTNFYFGTLLVYAALSTHANATFYVSEELVEPLSMESQPTSYDIPFYIKRNQLGPLGKKAMRNFLGKIQPASAITVTAYGDTSYGNELAYQRGQEIKKWLIQNGVPSEKISVIESQLTPPNKQKNIFNSTLTLNTHQSIQQTKVLDRKNNATLVTKEKYGASTSQASNQDKHTDSDTKKLNFIKKIIALSKSNAIKHEDAITLLADFIKDKGSATTQQNNAPQSLDIPAIAPSTAQFIASPIATPSWVLSKDKPLKENLDEWAKVAGWNQPVWKSKSTYQVTFSSTVHGTLIEAIEQIAHAIPNLDFHVWKNKGILEVSDKQP